MNSNNYKYFRIGSKLSKHLVFEVLPNGKMEIFTARDDYRYDKFPLSEEGKQMLKDWIKSI